MNDLIHAATVELAKFLNDKLPHLSADWWQKHVVARLSFQQQRMVQERGYQTLEKLDFAALLRVFDQNWYELSNALSLPNEARTWIKELQTVRNKWSHLSAESISPTEVYRDADTLGRLLTVIDASSSSLGAVESRKAEAVLAIASIKTSEVDSSSRKASEPVADSSAFSEARKSLFQIGDLVALRSNPTDIFPVIGVIPNQSECRYRVFQNAAKADYYESQLQPALEPTDNLKTLSAKEVQAAVTALQILSPSTATLFSLHSGRVHFVPYQYRPVLKLIRSDRPRLLIADEVGVGKTIEAGLIIKELRARMNLSSVLVICPKALVAERKWFTEMKRFDEQFTALDGSLLRHCIKETDLEGEWPEQYARAILPFSLFDSDLVLGRRRNDNKQDLGLLSLDQPPKFDLVIVDEAHHIRNAETYLHQGVRFFCDNAEAVIFLTATPVQLSSNDLYTLLNVLRPDLVIDQSSFERMAEPNAQLNAAVAACRAGRDGWQVEARSQLEGAAQTEWGRLFLRESSAFQATYDRLQSESVSGVDRIGLVRELEEMYTFSGLISRTRRRDIGEFTTRKPETLTIEFTSAQRELHDRLLDVVGRIFAFFHGQQNVKFMMTTIRRQAASCLYGLAPFLEGILNGKLDRLEFLEAADTDKEEDFSFIEKVRADIAVLLEQARRLETHDPKVEAFVRVLIDKSRLTNNKALVFSTFRHTLNYLAEHLKHTELRYGLIHGSIPDEERANIRRRFALSKEESDAIDVVLCSEVGCEGLDFQFCDFLINYDLPWNPMRIEQRIGRIDRYGQKSETVAIVNFVTPETVDSEIYERCLWRIGVFQHAIGGNEEILGTITEQLHDIAESFSLTSEERDERLRQLSDNAVRQIREEQDLESKQAELFGLDIPNQTWRDEIRAAESDWLSPAAIERCVSGYLGSRLGKETEHLLGEKAVKTLRLSQEARASLLRDYQLLERTNDLVSREWEKWLKGNEPILAISFEQQAATENPTVAHLSVMHPLVRQAASYLQLKEPAYASLSAKSAEVTPGKYQFGLYRWTKQGVKIDESLIAVASDPAVERALLKILQTAMDSQPAAELSRADFSDLESRHHSKWRSAQANHIAENRQQVEHRIQSLRVSHQARRKAIEDQGARATNAKIATMKQSELARADADFERRMTELQRQAGSGDIHTTAVFFGEISITA